MITCSKSIIIPKDVKKTYQIAERYPEFVDFYKKKEIIRADEFHSEVQIESMFCGLKFAWKGKGIKEKNGKITWIQSKGLLHGMKAEWLFFPLGQETRVTLTVNYFSPIPLWESVASVLFIKKTIPKLLNCLQNACTRQ